MGEDLRVEASPHRPRERKTGTVMKTVPVGAFARMVLG